MRARRWLYVLPLRLRSLFRGSQVDQELDEELQYHIEQLTREKIAQGMTASEARAAALRAMGGVTQRKEECRDARGIGFLENRIRDLRYGARMMLRTPGFTAIVVLSLALGMGANAAVFTLVNALLLRQLPVTDPQQLVAVEARSSKGEWDMISFPMYRDLRERQQVFTDMFATAGETPMRVTIPNAAGQPAELDNVRISFVTGGYWNVLGVRPALGRLFGDQDDQNPETSETSGSVTVLSYDFWNRQFGCDPGVLGRTLMLGHSPAVVVGVAPRGFYGEAVGEAPAAWVPLVPFSSVRYVSNRRGTFTSFMARLKPGISREQAQSAMTLLFQQLLTSEGRIRDAAAKHLIELQPGGIGLDRYLRRTFAKPLRIVMAMVVLVLLIACANVANLLSARAAVRRGEIGVRLAIGCSRRRLIGQLLTESVLLSLCGTAAGAVLGWWGSRALLQLVVWGKPIPIRLDIAPDVTVLAFLMGAGVLTGILFGLLPALHAAGINLVPALRKASAAEASRLSRQRLSRLLVAAQVALSLLLLIGSGLLIRSIHNLHQVDLGFHPEQVLIFDLAHGPQRRDPAALAQVARQVEQRVAQLPGVDSASVSGVLLFSDTDIGFSLANPEAPDEKMSARLNAVSPAYFHTVGMSLVEGRGIEDRDSENAPLVMVINQAMARRYWPNGSPLGRTLVFQAGPNQGKPTQIVGVLRDAKYNDLRADVKPMMYLPFAQMPRSLRSLEVRTSWPMPAIVAPARQALADISKDIMVRRVVPLAAQVDESLSAERLMMTLCSIFGALALLLACVGLYGVMSYAVAQRTGEIGIRMALGATQPRVLWLVLRETFVMVAAGVVFGIPLALASARFISSFLYGLSAFDARTIAVAALAMIAVGLFAGFLPARRASRVDPMVALRNE